ncbi:hypothetical protein SAMN05660742_105158 [Propionispira arboris]|uniref:Uncharacterized protein n=1 Tax=Propionispira arboris TaxID=84035 RepID=A0A1H6XWH3_9FIRM|nr:hypothetical protein SAMN05660742_105158 [Propionispira arboris]
MIPLRQIGLNAIKADISARLTSSLFHLITNSILMYIQEVEISLFNLT